jgi:hypothetical protein
MTLRKGVKRVNRRAGSVQLELAESVMDYSVREPSSDVKHDVGDDRAIEYGGRRKMWVAGRQ